MIIKKARSKAGMRTRRITLLINDEEGKELIKRAREADMFVSEYLRKVVFSH
jgi:hypothetical protein